MAGSAPARARVRPLTWVPEPRALLGLLVPVA